MTDALDLPAFLAVFCRVYAWASTAPFVGDAGVPGRVRAVCCILIAFALSPARTGISWSNLPSLIPSEVAIGLIAGFAVRLVIAAAETGGQLIGLELELGFASMIDPLVREESLPTRSIAYTLAGLAFLGADGLESTIRLLSMPGLSVPSPAELMSHIVAGIGTVMQLSLAIVAPILCAALVANLAMGLASRAAPALNVFSVMLACVLVLGGSTLITTAPHFVRDLVGIAHLAIDAPASLLAR